MSGFISVFLNGQEKSLALCYYNKILSEGTVKYYSAGVWVGL